MSTVTSTSTSDGRGRRRAVVVAVLVAACAAAVPARADDPKVEPSKDPARPVFGRVDVYMRMFGDVSPRDRAMERFRMPFLAMVHVGSHNTGVDGLSVETMGYGEVDAIEPLVGDRGTGDLLFANVSYRGLPDDMLFVRLGRQLLPSTVTNSAIIDGLTLRVRLPEDLYVEGWGGWRSEPGFDQTGDSWSAGARFAWNPIKYGHLALSYSHERLEGDIAHEVLGIDYGYRQLRWVDLVGYALIDLVELDLQEILADFAISPHKDWPIHLSYRRFDPDARIPKTSIFSVFNNRFYDTVGASLGWFPRNIRFSAYAEGSVYIYEDEELGSRFLFRPRYVFNRGRGDVVGVELSRMSSRYTGYWGVRAYGAWAPIRWLYLTADWSTAIHDEARNGVDTSHVGRLSSSFHVIEGLSILGEASVSVTPDFEQLWVGMLRIRYDFQGRAPSRRLSR